jgi:hypothetical protein
VAKARAMCTITVFGLMPSAFAVPLVSRLLARRRNKGTGRAEGFPGVGRQTVISAIFARRDALRTGTGQVRRELRFASAIFGETDGRHGQLSLRSDISG